MSQPQLIKLASSTEIQPSLSQPSNNRRQKSNSGDSFSFPSTPNQEESSDFEFGSLTPDSPSCKTSPADHLFLNGRLQPHSFPLSHCPFQQQQQQQQHYPIATTSRTSSIGSKDSLLSSRSNSTNSSCSSARTSSSDSSERRLFHNSTVSDRRRHHRHHNRAFGCSQRWQYITPVPALNRDASKRRRDMQQRTKSGEEKKKLKKKKQKMDTVRRVPLRFGRRIFRWLFTACRQCHAMEPSKAHKETVGCKKNCD